MEFTSELGANANWFTLPNTPIPDGVNFRVALSPGEMKRFYRLRRASDELTTVLETSPAAGETGVAVTRETIIRLSAPLSASTSINNQQFFARFGARRILSRIHLSADRRTLTLFYLEPLPSGATIRVTLLPEVLNDESNRAVDLDADGTAGGGFTLDFSTLSLAAVSETAVSGRVFSSELRPSANGTNAFVNVPLGGVTVTVDGMEESLRTVSDAMGNFRLEPVPAGEFFVHIDGRTVTNLLEGIRYPDMAYYPNVGKKWISVAGTNVNLGEIYLPLIPADTLKPLNMAGPTVLTFSPEFVAANPQFDGVSITIPADSLFSDDGLRGGLAGIAPVPPDRLPGPLPDGLPILDVVTVQTDRGSNFDVPVPACFPNLPDPVTGLKLAPGEKSALWSFNHDTGRFEIVGSMTVSADGKLICTDPGVGILAPGWHGTRPGVEARGGDIANSDNGNRSKPRSGAPAEAGKDDCDADGTCKTTHSVLLHSGEERLERTDLFIPGRGEIDFALERVYRSRLEYNGPVGYGWNFNYNEGLYIEGNGDVTRFNGRARLNTWQREPDGSFSSPAGDFRTLIQQPDGKYVLRSADGFLRTYRSDGRLFSVEDRFGNRMLFDYDGRGNLKRVIDVYGREIDFAFAEFSDGVDRLVRVTDFIGREVVYEYDENGDLSSVRSPVITGTSTGNDFPNGRIERYTYSTGFARPELNHNLLTVTFPEEVATDGPPGLVFTYGTDPAMPMTFDAILTETLGGTNKTGVAAGGTMSLHYAEINQEIPLGDPDIPRMVVTVTQRNGNQVQSFGNEHHLDIITRQLTRGLRAGEPAYYETRSYYDEDGQLIRRVFPEGNEVRYTYNSNGPRSQRQNLLEVRKIAGPRGGGEDLVTTFTYEPLYNQVASITSPRGNSPTYTPPLGSATPERYTTRFYYDYQESNLPIEQAATFNIDLSGIPRGLGDLNGDGRTNQIFGNRIRIQKPTVQLLPDSHEAALIGGTAQPNLTDLHWNDHGQLLAEIDPEGNVIRLEYHPENDPDGDGSPTFSPYVALTSIRRGYLARKVVDAGLSPRRRPSAPPPLALETRLYYDEVGNVIATRNPRGIVTEVEVNERNEITKIIRGTDVAAALSSGQLLLNESPKGYTTVFHYDANGRVIKSEIENRDSNTPGVGSSIEHTFAYDLLGKLVRRTAEVSENQIYTWQYRYDPEGLPTLHILPQGNQTLIRYDERDLAFQITSGFGSSEAATIQVDYDRNGNRIRATDAEDTDSDGQRESTTYVLDGFNRLIRTIDPLGNQIHRTRDPEGYITRLQALGHPANDPSAPHVLLADVSSQVDELGRVFQTDSALFVSAGFNPARAPQLHDQNNDARVSVRTEYDAASRVTFTLEDDLQSSRNVYDGANRLIAVIDQLGNTRRIAYDHNSNPTVVETTEKSPEALVADQSFRTIYVYDQLDRLVRATDNAGQTTRFLYDSRDNLIQRADPEGALTSDPLQLFAGQINGPGNTTGYIYDGLNRLTQQITDLRVDGVGAGALDTSNPHNPDGRIVLSYIFDPNSRLAQIIDDNGRQTTFGYDALDRKISHAFADGEFYSYQYDKDSNLRQMTDPNGSIITRRYDALNRPVETLVTRGTGVLGTTRETYSYDGLSRLTRATDDNGNSATSLQTVDYVFDSLGRILEERQNGKAISSRYSGDGKRTQIVYPGGRIIDRTFDLLDRVKSIRDGATALATSEWIGPGMRELRRVNGNGTKLSFLNDAGNQSTGYDAIKRLVALRVLSPAGVPIVDRQYTYNRASQRTSEQRNDDFGLTDTYAYDSAYRLIASEYDLNGSAGSQPRDLEMAVYYMDGVGNRRQVDRHSATTGIAQDPYAINNVNEYTSIRGVPQSNDDNGNLTDDASRRFAYDYRNRLVAVADKASSRPIAAYEYLPDSRRAKKTLYSPTTSGAIVSTTTFLWDGYQEIEEQNTSTGATQTTFVWSPIYIDELVHFQNSLGSFYPHQDARQNIIAITDSAGQLAEKNVYDDFGNAAIFSPAGSPRSTTAIGNPYQFQGRRLDAETGLLYFRNRYYNPQTGRFLQRDVLWDPANVGNPYSFVANNPINLVDPLGFNACSALANILSSDAFETGFNVVDSLADLGGQASTTGSAVNSAFSGEAPPTGFVHSESGTIAAGKTAADVAAVANSLAGARAAKHAKDAADALDAAMAAVPAGTEAVKDANALRAHNALANATANKDMMKVAGNAVAVANGALAAAQGGYRQHQLNKEDQHTQRANEASYFGALDGINAQIAKYKKLRDCGKMSQEDLVKKIEELHRLTKVVEETYKESEAGRSKSWWAGSGENLGKGIMDGLPGGSAVGNLFSWLAGDTFVVE